MKKTIMTRDHNDANIIEWARIGSKFIYVARYKAVKNTNIAINENIKKAFKNKDWVYLEKVYLENKKI